MAKASAKKGRRPPPKRSAVAKGRKKSARDYRTITPHAGPHTEPGDDHDVMEQELPHARCL